MYIIFPLLASGLIYFVTAVVMIIIDGSPESEKPNEPDISFEELKADYSNIPALESYVCRDGEQLNYRRYPSDSDKIMILIHGSGSHSRYFFPLAEYISSHNIAKVYTPDLRGHGATPSRRGDIRYINQLEDDLADFIAYVKGTHKDSKIILSGHSSGGGLVIRFAGRKYSKLADAYLLLSPYLKYNAPTMRNDSGGWTHVHMPRIIGLAMLNNIGIKLFNYLDVLDFNMIGRHRDGMETLTYSYRLMTGFAPADYRKELQSIDQDVLLAVGTADESFIAEAFAPEILRYNKHAKVITLDNVTHMGLVTGEEIRPVIEEWVNGL